MAASNIPFRCPNCGDREQFSTLTELRDHLQTVHVYTTGRSQRRLNLSNLEYGENDDARFGRHSPLRDMFYADAKRLEEELKKNKEEELNNKRRRKGHEDLTALKASLPDYRKSKGRNKTSRNTTQNASFRDYGHPSRLNKYYDPSGHRKAKIECHRGNNHDSLYSDDSNDSNSSQSLNGKLERECENFRDYLHDEKINKPGMKASNGKSKLHKESKCQLPEAPHLDDKHVRDTLIALSNEVVLERTSQQATANSLYAAQDALSSVQEAAGQRIAKQQSMIEELADELKEKERRLGNVLQDMESLRLQQIQNLEKVNSLRQQSDMENEHLNEELFHKQKKLDDLNEQIAKTQQIVKRQESLNEFQRPVKLSREENLINNTHINESQSVPPQAPNILPKENDSLQDQPLGHETQQDGDERELEDMLKQAQAVAVQQKEKEEELRKIKAKAQHLERDRQNLLMEMQNLLETAATDNEKLRAEMEYQGKTMARLDSDLEHSKQEQAELLDETNALYKQADVSLAKLKAMLKDREHQLTNMSSSLEQAKSAQNMLARERDECLRHAEEREAVYRSMITSDKAQVMSMKEMLGSNEEEKLKLKEKLEELRKELEHKDGKDRQLTENVTVLKAELTKQEKSQAKLRAEIQRREEKLKKAKHEMSRMTAYLKDTADKEVEARSKLEVFISGLIERAEKAETKLEKLKSSYGHKPSNKGNVSKERDTRHDDVPDLSRLPGVSSIASPRHKSKLDDVSLSDEEDTSYLDPPVRHSHSKNRPQYHSTPKKRSAHSQTKSRTVDSRTADKNITSKGSGRNRSRQVDTEEYPSDEDQEGHEFERDVNRSQLFQGMKHGQQQYLQGQPVLMNPQYQNLEALNEKPAAQLGLNQQPSPISQQQATENLQAPTQQQFSSLLQMTTAGQNFHPVFHDNAYLKQRAVDPSMQPTDASYCHTLHLKASSPYHYSCAAPGGTTPLVFENTPEVERIFRNVDLNAYSKPFRLPLSTTLPVAGETYKNSHDRDEVDSVGLSLDENGILWGQVPSSSYVQSYSEFHSPKYDSGKKDGRKMTAHETPNLKGIDDTDIDEDLTDYLYDDEEQKKYNGQSEDAKIFPSKRNEPESDTITKSKVHTLKTDPIPLGEKIEKLLTSLGPKASNSAARQNYGLNLNSKSSNAKLNSSKLANEYSASDSSENSPLEKARQVQKRVEKLTAKKSDYHPANSLSKQSDGFEVNHFAADSDVSSSSYASLARVKSQNWKDTKLNFADANSDTSNVKYSNAELTEVPTKGEKDKSGFIYQEVKPVQTISNTQSVDLQGENRLDKSVTSEENQETESNITYNSFSVLSESAIGNNQIEEKKVTKELSKAPSECETRKFEKKTLKDTNPAKSGVKQGQNSSSTRLNNIPKQDRQIVQETPIVASKKVPRERGSTLYKQPVPVSETFQTAEVRQSVLKEENPVVASESSQPSRDKESTLKQENPVSETEISPTQEGKEPTLDLHENATEESEMSEMSGMKEPTVVIENNIQASESSQSETNLPQSISDDFGNDNVNLSTEDEDRAKFESADLKPAQKLRARITTPEDTSELSSEDEPVADFDQPDSRLPHRTSVDASTDTDIEKLAMPGHLQRRKKKVPLLKLAKRKKTRKMPARKQPSLDSLSCSEDLDDEQQAKRQAARRTRVALFRIFAYLDTNTLLTVTQVSREWRNVGHHPALWKRVSLRDRCISSQAQDMHGLRGRGIMAEETPEDYQMAIRGSLEPGLEKLLSSSLNTMTALHIEDCDDVLTNKCLWLVSGYCRLLTKLTYLSSTDPITPQLMWALGGGCPGVTSLFVYPQHPCEKTNVMNNRCLLLISQFYKDVEEVGLGGKEFDIAGLVPLVQSCQHLKCVHFDHCLPITADLATALCRAGLKQLQALSITGTSVEAKALQAFQGSCRQLSKIHITMNIKDCVDDPSKKKNKQNYTKMVKALEDLKKKTGFSNIFTLDAAPVE